MCPLLLETARHSLYYGGCITKLKHPPLLKKVGLNKNQLHYLVETHLPGHYDNLMIDLSKDTPAFLRKNIFEKLPVPDLQ